MADITFYIMYIFIIFFFFFIFPCLCLIWSGYNDTTESKSKTSLYEAKLRDPKWKARREEILNRDNHTCQWCGRTNNLQVHHKSYEKYPDGRMAEPWDYPDKTFITLCRDCHKKYHEKYTVHTFYRRRGIHYWI